MNPLPAIPPLKVIPQLIMGESLRCGDSSLSVILHRASRGLIQIPSSNAGRVKFWDELRERGDIPAGGGSQIPGLEKAFESFAPAFAKVGLTAPQMRKLNPGSWGDDVLPWLRKGSDHMVLFGMFYGTFNWLIKGSDILSGQPGLRIDHWTALAGKAEGPIPQADPLADGRRAGIAKGVQRIPPRILRLAAGSWDRLDTQPIGRGNVVAGLVRASQWLDEEPAPEPEPIPEPPPKPDPKPDPRDPCDDVRMELEQWRAEYDALGKLHHELFVDNERLEAQLTEWRGWVDSHPEDPEATGAEPSEPTGVDAA